jgi:hypothetical protein
MRLKLASTRASLSVPPCLGMSGSNVKKKIRAIMKGVIRRASPRDMRRKADLPFLLGLVSTFSPIKIPQCVYLESIYKATH